MSNRTTALRRAALLLLLLGCLATLPSVANAAVQYSSGSTTVSITEETIDDNNSTKRCVTYTSNAPEQYDTACFTTIYTDGGTFFQCDVEFHESCNRCGPCVTSEDEVGYDIDCFNAKPSINTYGCMALTDENMQGVLVDENFAPFDWEAANPDKSAALAAEESDNDGTGDNSAAAAAGNMLLSAAVLGALTALL